MSIHHLRKCCARSITSADILLEDAYRDLLPEDPQVRTDFGFDRCLTKSEEHLLFGVYQGLVKVLEVDSVSLHKWREEGILLDEITKSFGRVPEGRRGGYYPWFVKNTSRLFPSSGTAQPVHGIQEHDVLLMLEKYRDRLADEDQNASVAELEPHAKKSCFLFFVFLMEGMHPNPTVAPSAQMWYEFGFATCRDEHDESNLARMYLSLLDPGGAERRYREMFGESICTPQAHSACTFDEFWRSWSSGRLVDLFAKYKVKEGWLRDCHNLYQFLNCPQGQERPSIWRLKHLLALDAKTPLGDFPEIREAVGEYGFTHRMNTRVKIELREFYKELLLVRDPQEVHQAREQGKLFVASQNLLKQYSPDISDLVQSLDANS